MTRHLIRCLMLAALGMAMVAPGAHAQQPLRIASGVDGSFMQLVVAVEKGFMKEEGLNATIRQFPAGGLALESIVAGEADLALATELPTINVAAKGAKVKAVARGPYSNRLIAVGAISGIKTPADFVGKSIGYSKGTASDLYLNEFFAHHKIAKDKVKLVNVAPPELVPTMARGDIQIMFSWEPWFTRLRGVMPNTSIVARSGDDGVYTMQYVLVFSDQLLQSRPADARRALAALVKATDWLNDPKNAREAVALMMKSFRIAQADAEQMQQDVVFTIDLPPGFKGDMIRIADWMKKEGVAKINDSAALIDGFIAPALYNEVRQTK